MQYFNKNMLFYIKPYCIFAYGMYKKSNMCYNYAR